MKKKTLVFGASVKPHRYSNFAITRLVSSGHNVVAFGLRKGTVSGVEIDTELIQYPGIDTITMYMNAQRQKQFYHYLTGLKPKRIIFNPGAENPEFFRILEEKGIAFESACTLVLLSTDQY
ncbi:CoA-binding protein [Aegicerativicinus sediminis]